MPFGTRRGPAPMPCPRCSKSASCSHCTCVYCPRYGSACEATLPAGSRDTRRLCKYCREVCIKMMSGVDPVPLMSSSLGQGHSMVQFHTPSVTAPPLLAPYLLPADAQMSSAGCADGRLPASDSFIFGTAQRAPPHRASSSPSSSVSSMPSYGTPISSTAAAGSQSLDQWGAAAQYSSAARHDAWSTGGTSVLDGETTKPGRVKARKPTDFLLAQDGFRVMDDSLFRRGGLGVVGLGVSRAKESEGTAILVTARYKAGLDGPCLAIDAAHHDTLDSITLAHAWVVLSKAKILELFRCEPPSPADWEAFRKGEILVEMTPATIFSGNSFTLAYTLAFVGLLTKARPRTNTAITGAMSFLGEVLEVGGLEGKTRGTARAGIRRLLLPQPCLTDRVQSHAATLSIELIAIRNVWEAIKAIFPLPTAVPGALQVGGRYATGLYGKAHGLQMMGSDKSGWRLAVQTVECVVLPGRGRVSVLSMVDDDKVYDLWIGRASQAVEFLSLEGQLERLARCRLWPGASLQDCDIIFRGSEGSMGSGQLMLPVHLALAHAIEGSTCEDQAVASGEVVGLHGEVACDGLLMGSNVGDEDVGGLRRIRFKTFPSLRVIVVPLQTKPALLAAMKKKDRSTLKDFGKEEVLKPDTLEVVGAADFWEALAAVRRGWQPNADMELCPPPQPRSYLPAWGRRFFGGM